jgi:superfamily II DNA/RNA helicase
MTEGNSMSPTFDALGVAPDLVAGLAAAGINAPMPIQALTIADALAGRDVCGKAGTGSGKTLAFGLPLLQRTGRARPGQPMSLVLVPTRELAVQVGDVLAGLAGARGRRVTVVYGGVPIERHIRALRRGADVVVATPGRLIDLIERRHVSLSQVRITVLDEADRMADMGFLPQVERLLAATHRGRQTMLFSATLDGDVDHLVRRHMNAPVRHEVASPKLTIESMTHHFLSVAESDRAGVVSSMAAGADRTLVFVRTKHGADRLAKRLRQHGVEAGALHGGISQAARQRALDRFAAGTLPVLVATDVAARGLDVAGLDLVVHYDPPQDNKTYLHRSGRTARAGAAGVVVTLVLDHQRRDVRRMQRQLDLDHPIVPAHHFNAKQLAATG